jgi:hypothetical protein
MIKESLSGLIIILTIAFSTHVLSMEPTPDNLQFDGTIKTPPYTGCLLKPDPGPCKGRFDGYYFDGNSRTCKLFFHGGCQGTIPFKTEDECEKECLAPTDIRIESLKPLKGEPYARVSIEFPKKWESPLFTIQVDGKEINTKRESGGFSIDRQMESFLFFPGKPGEKAVIVSAVVNGKKYEAGAAMNWQPSSFLMLMEHEGNRTLILKEERLSIVAANVEQVVITFNGKVIEPSLFGNNATLFSFQPVWRSGVNILNVTGKGGDRKDVSRTYSFYLLKEGLIKEGETVMLVYGCEGSKSGPFFEVLIEGNALTSVKDEYYIHTPLIKKAG